MCSIYWFQLSKLTPWPLREQVLIQWWYYLHSTWWSSTLFFVIIWFQVSWVLFSRSPAFGTNGGVNLIRSRQEWRDDCHLAAVKGTDGEHSSTVLYERASPWGLSENPGCNRDHTAKGAVMWPAFVMSGQRQFSSVAWICQLSESTTLLELDYIRIRYRQIRYRTEL